MTKPIKKPSSRDKAELVEVQGSTEAEASSHRSRKSCRTVKIVEASSDQPQKGGRRTEVVKPSSDQTKKRGPKAKLSPEEKIKNKRACDNKRYHKKEDTLREIGEMKPQLKVLEDRVEELLKQIGNLREIGEMKPQLKVLEDRVEEMLKQIGNLKGDIEVASLSFGVFSFLFMDGRKVVKNDLKKMESLPEKFLQKELTDDDLMSLEIPLDNDFLGGEEYRAMVLGSSQHISNGVSGMSKQEILGEFKKTREHLEELRRENEEFRREKEELNSRVTDIETMIRAMTPKK
ncbi:hypothetical protein SLE2022_267900 [Rubroshorea leprosula]